jgi:hypothetical protein
MECDRASTFFIYLHQLAGKIINLAGCYLGTYLAYQHGVGFSVTAMADTNTYRTKIKVTDAKNATINHSARSLSW